LIVKNGIAKKQCHFLLGNNYFCAIVASDYFSDKGVVDEAYGEDGTKISEWFVDWDGRAG
jgi:hypothetical protein